jgi:hypothetical protein
MIDSYQIKCIVSSKLNRTIDTNVEYIDKGYSIRCKNVLYNSVSINELKHELDRYISEEYTIFDDNDYLGIKVTLFYH